jgi:hypothetical protein
MASKTKSLYSRHPGFRMIETFKVNLVERTGKTIEQWVELVRQKGPPTEKERRIWLKVEHGLTTNYAWWVAEQASGTEDLEHYDPEGMVEAMFAGPKAALRPFYDKLLLLGLGAGPDAIACPCKTIVPFYRKHVFAQLKPATKARLEVGFALGDTPCTGRLQDTGGFAKKDRITHMIPIARAEEIDAEVKRWLKVAYDRDGEEKKAKKKPAAKSK